MADIDKTIEKLRSLGATKIIVEDDKVIAEFDKEARRLSYVPAARWIEKHPSVFKPVPWDYEITWDGRVMEVSDG